jgi:hypothetical protein
LEQCRKHNLRVFRADRRTGREWNDNLDPDDDVYAAGIYWECCAPGCLPDGGPFGPFKSTTAACKDVIEGLNE